MDQILNVLSSLGFNWHVALANFVNFLIILFLLNKFVFSKIKKVIHHRDEIIKQGLKDAEDAKMAKEKIEDERKDVIKQAEIRSNEIINEAHSKGEHIMISAKDIAETEADKIISEANAKKAKAKDDAMAEFSLIAPKLVADLTKKALKENMAEGVNNKLIENLSK